MLVLFAFNEEAYNLQNAFDGLLSLIKGSMTEIWTYNSEAKILGLERPPQSTVNSILGNMEIIGRHDSSQHPGMHINEIFHNLHHWSHYSTCFDCFLIVPSIIIS